MTFDSRSIRHAYEAKVDDAFARHTTSAVVMT